jgi:hypothetical protein
MIIASAFVLVGGVLPDRSKKPTNLTAFTPITAVPTDKYYNLQLKTINFKSCGNIATVGFLIDRSGSMSRGTKLANLKSALQTFATTFPDEGLISLISFTTDNSGRNDITVDIPFNLFKNVKNLFLSAIARLDPEGGTPTKDAFIVAQQEFARAKTQYPTRDFSMVFISDGIPETLANNRLCPGGSNSRYCTPDPRGGCRCFDVNQDPYLIADQIKQSGVRIFSIGYIHEETEQKFKDDLTNLMRRVASSEEDFYFAPIDNQLTGILSQITKEICEN